MNLKHKLAGAVVQAITCMTATAPLLMLPTWASAAEQAQADFDIPAGPLAPALSRFGQAAHILLSYPSTLTAGRSTAGLHGNFDVDQGLAMLLAGSGLEASRSANGNYTLQASSSGAMELSAVSISGKAPGSTTEGTGLYTTYSSSSSTRLNLTPQETPQSLTVMTRQRLDDQRLTNLTDALEATPGIIVVRDGLGAESDSYWSRGFAIQNYEVDGVPTNTRLDNYSQSMAMYDRVEIVRGATGLISGMGNPSATINLIRKRPTADAQASITGEAGTWDRYGTGFDVSGPLTEAGNIRGRFVADYKTEKAWIDRYSSQSQLI